MVHFALTSNIESMKVIQPQHKGGAFKGPAKGQCLNCVDEQEYDLTVPVNRMVGKSPSPVKTPPRPK